MMDVELKDFDRSRSLLLKALAIANVPGQPYDFRCPICGGMAHAVKSTVNGHVHTFCNDCHTNIIQ